VITAFVAPGHHWTPLPELSWTVVGPAALLWFVGACAIMLSMDGAMAVIAPAWILPDAGQTAFEAMGRELFQLASRTVILGVVVAPIAAAAYATARVCWPWMGQGALLLSGLVAATASLAVAEVVCAWAGRRLDQLDPSCEGM